MYTAGSKYGVSSTLTDDTIYQGRIEMEETDAGDPGDFTCSLFIDDPLDGDTLYGVGDLLSVSQAGLVYDNADHDIIGYFHQTIASGGWGTIIGNVALCDGTPTPGVRCEP